MLEFEKKEDIEILQNFKNISLVPDKEKIFSFNLSKVEANKNYTLRLIGHTDYPKEHRCETYFPLYYRKLDDCLYEENADTVLRFNCNNEIYDRGFYYKVYGNEIKDINCKAELSIDVNIKNKLIARKSLFELTAEIYFIKDEQSNYFDKADEIVKINLKDATEIKKTFSKTFNVDRPIDFIMIHLNTNNISGEIQVSSPKLQINEKNIVSKFEKCDVLDEGRYIGDGLSKSEWPFFEIYLNDKLIFRGEKFERIYTNPAFEFDIEKNVLQNSNDLRICIINNKSIPKKFLLKNIELCSYYSDFQILACPNYVTVGEKFSVIIQTNVDNKKVEVLFNNKSYKKTFEKKGINFIELKLNKVLAKIPLKIISDDEYREVFIDRSVIKENDNIITGTSDSVFIDQNISDYTKFLLWYMNNGVGNAITFRPSYRWSGCNFSNKDVWSFIKNFCEKANLKYIHMIDGRELNGCNANPEKEWLIGKNFLGTQSHENDGSYNYWGNGGISRTDELFLNVFSKKMKFYGIFPLKTPVYHGNSVSKYINPIIAKDMKEGCEYFCQNISQACELTDRHSGPSALFKYFYQTGMNYLLSELMYQANELSISFLRGASKAYRKEHFGSHIAIQWSTIPHDDIYRYRRYMLVLFECYMLGLTEINTEEGLWRIEDGLFDFERFSDACINHKLIQNKFYNFIKTHTRRGKHKADFAVLHGKFDAYTLFVKQNSWAQNGHEWQYSEIEESWDLLKIFYPDAVFDAIYHPTAKYEQWGYFSGMPYGDIDVIPTESDIHLFNEYKFIFMLGYQTLDNDDISKLLNYVKNGGILLFGLPHLFTSFDKENLLNGSSDILNNKLVEELIGVKILDTNVNEYKKIEIVKDNSTFNDNVIFNNLGKGKVVFINNSNFPANRDIRNEYEKQIKNILDNLVNENDYCVLSDGNISSSKYINNDTIIHYILNVNWWGDNDFERAKFKWRNKTFDLNIHRENIAILTTKNQISVLTNDNETDIIEIENYNSIYSIKLQGAGITTLTIYSMCNFEICQNEDIELLHDYAQMKTIKINLNGVAKIEIKII